MCCGRPGDTVEAFSDGVAKNLHCLIVLAHIMLQLERSGIAHTYLEQHPLSI